MPGRHPGSWVPDKGPASHSFSPGPSNGELLTRNPCGLWPSAQLWWLHSLLSHLGPMWVVARGFAGAAPQSSEKGPPCAVVQDKDESLAGEHVREGLTAVVAVKVGNPEFEGQTKASIGQGCAHQHPCLFLLRPGAPLRVSWDIWKAVQCCDARVESSGGCADTLGEQWGAACGGRGSFGGPSRLL